MKQGERAMKGVKNGDISAARSRKKSQGKKQIQHSGFPRNA